MSPVNFHDYRELVYRCESGELIINYWGRAPLYSVSPDRSALSPSVSVAGRPPGAQGMDPDQISESWSSWDQPGLDPTPGRLGVHPAFSRFAALSSLRSLAAGGRV